MQPSNRPTITIVGHVCIDHNTVDGIYHESWGSAALYIARYLAGSHSIQSRIHATYGKDMLDFADKNIFIDPPSYDHPTLVYENTITHGLRVQSVTNQSWAIPVMSQALEQRLANTDILIIAPLLPDHSPSYVQSLCQLLPKSAIKILLPQGYYRYVNTSGQIEPRTFTESNDILPLVDVLIQSDEDSSDAVTTAQKWAKTYPHFTTVVTRGSDGLSAFTGNQSFVLSTTPVLPNDIVNPVGAGDVFSAELALSLYGNIPLPRALKNAQRAAYRHVSGKKSDDTVQI